MRVSLGTLFNTPINSYLAISYIYYINYYECTTIILTDKGVPVRLLEVSQHHNCRRQIEQHGHPSYTPAKLCELLHVPPNQMSGKLPH